MFRGTRNKSSRARQGHSRRTIYLLAERVPGPALCDSVAHKPNTCIGGTTEIHPASKAGWRVGSSSSLIGAADSYYLDSCLHQTVTAEGPALLFQYQVPTVPRSYPFHGFVKSMTLFLFRQSGESLTQGVAV